MKRKARPKSPEQIYREKEHHFYREISDHYHRLKAWKEEFQPKSMEEEWDDHFVEAVKCIPAMEEIMDTFLASDRAGREELFKAHQPPKEGKEKKEIKSQEAMAI